MQAGCSTPSLAQATRWPLAVVLSGDDVKTENPHEQDADIVEELKQIALREIHTHPGYEDVSAVGIYPVTDEVAERHLVCPSRKQRRALIPKSQAALRFASSTSFVTNTIC